MSALDRICQIDQILAERKVVPRLELQERLGVSWATLKRDLSYMKDRLNAPIVHDRERGGYGFENAGGRVGPQNTLHVGQISVLASSTGIEPVSHA